MAPVFSRRLLVAQGPTSSSYVVPAGQTAVIRTIAAVNPGAGVAGYDVAINPSGALVAAQLLAAFGSALPASYQSQLDVRIALAAGEGFTINPGGTVWVTVSGYLFLS